MRAQRTLLKPDGSSVAWSDVATLLVAFPIAAAVLVLGIYSSSWTLRGAIVVAFVAGAVILVVIGKAFPPKQRAPWINFIMFASLAVFAWGYQGGMPLLQYPVISLMLGAGSCGVVRARIRGRRRQRKGTTASPHTRLGR
jgi:xanthine/uracil permease